MSIVSSSTSLELLLLLTILKYVLWHLKQGCWLQTPCEVADTLIVPEMLQQYKLPIGEHHCFSLFHSKASDSFSATFFSRFKRNNVAWTIIQIRLFAHLLKTFVVKKLSKAPLFTICTRTWTRLICVHFFFFPIELCDPNPQKPEQNVPFSSWVSIFYTVYSSSVPHEVGKR